MATNFATPLAGTTALKIPANSTETPKGHVTEAMLSLLTQTLTNKTLADFSNLVIADGQHAEVRNDSGAVMSLGDVVYISGYHVGSELPTVQLADSSTAATMPSIGVVAETIANNASGAICVSGRMTLVDTSAFTAGDAVYVSETGGQWGTRPSGATTEVQKVGIVYRSHATLGVVQIVGAGRSNDIPNRLLSSLLKIADSADETKLVDFDVSAVGTGTKITITVPNAAVDLTVAAVATIDTGTNNTQSVTALGLAGSALQTTADGAAQPDGVSQWSKFQGTDEFGLTDGATINWDLEDGQNARVTIAGNRTMAAPTNLAEGYVVLELTQDATGSRTITWNAAFKFGDAGEPTLSTGANKIDMLQFYCNGTDMRFLSIIAGF